MLLPTGNHKEMRAWSAKPQRERAGRMRLFLAPKCSSLFPCPSHGFPLAPEILLVHPSPPNSGMQSRTVGEGGMQELPWDALLMRVPQVPQPGCCSFQGKSGKDERETRTLQLRSLQYLERYIFLILFNAYLHLEKKDSWQRPFSLWMREVRLSLAATSLGLVFTWKYRNLLESRHPSLTYM